MNVIQFDKKFNYSLNCQVRTTLIALNIKNKLI